MDLQLSLAIAIYVAIAMYVAYLSVGIFRKPALTSTQREKGLMYAASAATVAYASCYNTVHLLLTQHDTEQRIDGFCTLLTQKFKCVGRLANAIKEDGGMQGAVLSDHLYWCFECADELRTVQIEDKLPMAIGLTVRALGEATGWGEVELQPDLLMTYMRQLKQQTQAPQVLSGNDPLNASEAR